MAFPQYQKLTSPTLAIRFWSTHTSSIIQHITRSSIQTLESLFPGAIFHCEDNHASCLRIFCPCLCYQAIERTFLDPAVFSQVDQSPEAMVLALVSKLETQYGKSMQIPPPG